jgi:hypothetical protein
LASRQRPTEYRALRKLLVIWKGYQVVLSGASCIDTYKEVFSFSLLQLRGFYPQKARKNQVLGAFLPINVRLTFVTTPADKRQALPSQLNPFSCRIIQYEFLNIELQYSAFAE